MSRSLRQAVCLAVIAAVLVSCATSPTGRRQLMLVSEDMAINSSAEAYVQEVGRFKAEGKLSRDRALIERIDGITERLVAQAIQMRPKSRDWQWSVAVIDDPETVNAWCMAGGRMAIYTGLIQKIQPSDDEIAQVMGHEIAHALANHTAEKMSVSMASSIGVLAVGIASDNTGAAMAGAAAAAALAIKLPNSRTAETEADRIGIELAARAGYDPAAAVTLWEKMNAVGGSPPQFLSTHPSPENRAATLARLGPKMEPYYREGGARPRHPVQTVTAFN